VSLGGRILVFGGSGQLGTELQILWKDADLRAPSSAEVSIEDAESVDAALNGFKPEIVVNCAAFHHVDLCEREAERAFAVNALAVDALARACAARNCTFVTISTDYVFDGKRRRPYVETDDPHPISTYGVSKLAGELLVLRLQSSAYVIRTCGLYGRRPSANKGYTFIDRVLRQARAGEPLRIVNDQTISPTNAAHLASSIDELLRRKPAYGLYHAVNEGAVTWYEFACEALRQAELQASIEPISSGEWKGAARRPPYSALENAKLHALGMKLPDLRAGIAYALTGFMMMP